MFKQGRIADRGAQAQQYHASGLNLLIAAIVYWNATDMADLLTARFESQGGGNRLRLG